MLGEDKERERRRKRYKFALVKWTGWELKGLNLYAVEHKENLIWKASYTGPAEVICDWEPEKVLRGMLKLLQEETNNVR